MKESLTSKAYKKDIVIQRYCLIFFDIELALVTIQVGCGFCHFTIFKPSSPPVEVFDIAVLKVKVIALRRAVAARTELILAE